MSANDHHDAAGDEVALKRFRLKKVEDAIAHTEKSLADLREVRDALKAELQPPKSNYTCVVTGCNKVVSSFSAALCDEHYLEGP